MSDFREKQTVGNGRNSSDFSDEEEQTFERVLNARLKVVPKRKGPLNNGGASTSTGNGNGQRTDEAEMSDGSEFPAIASKSAGHLWTDTVLMQSLEEKMGVSAGPGMTITELRDRGTETYAPISAGEKRKRNDDIADEMMEKEGMTEGGKTDGTKDAKMEGDNADETLSVAVDTSIKGNGKARATICKCGAIVFPSFEEKHLKGENHQKKMKMPWLIESNKLPELAKPSLYQIFVSLNLNTCKFKGKQTIHLEITKPTNYLKLHLNALDVEKASLKLNDGIVFPDLKREIDAKWTQLTVLLPQKIRPQKAELEFVYNGELTTNMKGFYKSTYKDSEGNEMAVASTQFESTYARNAFPCWDEPTYKAQFDITLEVDKDMTALSNMNVTEEKHTETGTKMVTFARTPFMSTYLVAFAVGNFEYVEGKSKTGANVRIYSVPGKKEQGNYALEVVTKSIDFYSEWFDFKMPLPKCDVLAMPDFAMGAMENWGLITARENCSLYDPTKSPSTHKQLLPLLLSRRVAHFWFGNIDTKESEFWIKEGFASFMQNLFTVKNYPEFKIWSDFVDAEVVSRAMALDSLRSTHPIEVPIDNPNELEEIYDSITYAKSNSIIRMLFNHLGEATFQEAFRFFLKNKKKPKTDNLCKSLTRVSQIQIDVKALMSSWTQQMGFPLFTVEEKILDGDRIELHLKQSRFLADGSHDEANPVWQVPFGVTTATNPTHPKAKFLLMKAEDKFIVDGVKSNEWVKVNSNFSSFFRVQYSPNMLKSLLDGVKNRELGVLDRYQLASDLYALVKSSRVSVSHFLALLTVCQEEEDYFVWFAIDSGIGSIAHSLKHLDDERKLLDRFERFVCKMIEPVAAKLGWEPNEGETIHIGRLRALLLSRLSHFRHQPTIQMALSKFNALVEKGVDVVPDLRKLIFRAVGSTNDEKIIAALKNLMETSGYAQVELSCVLGLGQCSDLKMLEDIFNYGVIQGKIRDQELYLLFAATKMAPMACCGHFAWDFFKNNFALLIEKYGSVNSNVFLHCFECVTSGFCSNAMAEEIMEFFKKELDGHSLKTLERPLRQTVKSIKFKERVLKNTVPDLDKYLQNVGN
ncbi:hypothetical protein niasHT_022407 [Heterodera trifolii]|uniref:Puromycin-sensitive aminopeptidase n=1 Tax=Heterodera trifolii TaxID=157864 RepID=A0ABD2KLR8_9BILA